MSKRLAIMVLLRSLIGIIIIAAVRCTPCAQDQKRYEFSKPKMGTEFRLIFYCGSDLKADALQAASFKKLDMLNQIFSDYEIDSETSRLSQFAGTDTLIEVSGAMNLMLSRVTIVSDLTNGLFDVTVGALTKLWRRAFRRNEFPTAKEISEARDKVGFHHLEVYPFKKIKIKQPGMSFDFGAVAKGFAIDDIARYLKREGVNIFLVDGGGDISVGDPPPGKDGWVIGLDDGSQLKLDNISIASSGSKYKYLEWDGQRYSHIINPQTGYGVTDPKTVTVKAVTCFMADMIATTYSLGGRQGVAKLLDAVPEHKVEIIDHQ